MTKSRLAGACIIAVAFAAVSLMTTADAQKTKGKTRPAETKYLMRGILKPNCAGLGATLKAGPKTDEDWDKAACQAACMNELGHSLMADGRCPDGTWAKASKALQEGSAAALKAIAAKDLDAANAAFKTATSSCGTCHKAHK